MGLGCGIPTNFKYKIYFQKLRLYLLELGIFVKFGENPCLHLGCGISANFIPTTVAAWVVQGMTI